MSEEIEDLSKRLFSRVNKTETCWLWTGGDNYSGYGSMQFRRKTISTHRASWIVSHGSIPAGMWVLHKCDVRLCVRPEHLYLGDNKKNIQDAIDRKRHPRGEKVLKAKFTEAQVIEMRAEYARNPQPFEVIAAKYGETSNAVRQVIRGANWKHLPGEVKVKTIRVDADEYDALQAKLSLYTSWQPSDPGTKEAMEWAETLIANPKDYGIEDGPAKPHLEALVRSTRAAMVRLEEADGSKAHEECLDNAMAINKSWNEEKDKVAALTASLASVTEERDEYYQDWQAMKHYKKVRVDALTASLAELRKAAEREAQELRDRMIKTMEAEYERGKSDRASQIDSMRAEFMRLKDQSNAHRDAQMKAEREAQELREEVEHQTGLREEQVNGVIAQYEKLRDEREAVVAAKDRLLAKIQDGELFKRLNESTSRYNELDEKFKSVNAALAEQAAVIERARDGLLAAKSWFKGSPSALRGIDQYLAALPAPQPSPAPVESKPKDEPITPSEEKLIDKIMAEHTVMSSAREDVLSWAQATLTALNVGDVRSGSLLHLKLREVLIAYRLAADTAKPSPEGSK